MGGVGAALARRNFPGSARQCPLPQFCWGPRSEGHARCWPHARRSRPPRPRTNEGRHATKAGALLGRGVSRSEGWPRRERVPFPRRASLVMPRNAQCRRRKVYQAQGVCRWVSTGACQISHYRSSSQPRGRDPSRFATHSIETRYRSLLIASLGQSRGAWLLC